MCVVLYGGAFVLGPSCPPALVIKAWIIQDSMWEVFGHSPMNSSLTVDNLLRKVWGDYNKGEGAQVQDKKYRDK